MPIKGSNKDDTPKGTLYCLDELGNVKKIMDIKNNPNLKYRMMLRLHMFQIVPFG